MQSRKKRICIVMPCHWSHAMGGAEYQVKIIVELLIESGEYEIYFMTRDVDPTYNAEGYSIIKVSNIFYRKRGGFFLDAGELLSNFNAIKPDVIYQRSGTGYTGVCAFYSKRKKCKFIWHIAHDKDISPIKFSFSRDLLLKMIEKKILEYGIRNATYIVSQTHDQAKMLKNNYGRSVFAVINNFHPLPSLPIEKDKVITIIWIANLKPIKRPEIFLRLVEDLKDMQNIQFIMIGKLQGRPKWIKKYEKWIEQSKNLDYMGFLKQAEVNKILAKSHILVNASEAEGFSNTFIQAWMRKVPVVSLTVNPDDILTRERIGMCSGNYDQLLADIKMLIKNDDLRNKMGVNAQIYAFDNYSERNADKLLALFK